jgi:hypothetical protein
MKVFTRKKYLEWALKENVTLNEIVSDLNLWVDFCDGKEVIENNISGTNYVVIPEWCEYV